MSSIYPQPTMIGPPGEGFIQTLITALQQAAGMERRPPPEAKVYPSMLVDVYNPSRRMRIIYPMATYEGLGIEPGQKLRNVRMALHVIEGLRAQGVAEMAKLKVDPHAVIDQPLVITEAGGAEVDATAEAVGA